MSPSRKCRLAFIGCGQLMNTQHIQNAHNSNVCTVHTLCDIDAEALQKTAEKFPPVKTTPDYKTALADPDVDLVVIAMNPNMHAKLAIEALKAGKPVYVEKPLGVTYEEALAVAKAVKKTGAQCAVGFNRRFSPAYNDVKPLLKPREGPLLIYYRIADHERYKRAETLRLHVEVCHIFDILHWFTEAEPVTVYATEGLHNDNAVMLRFEDGTTAMILSSGRSSLESPKERLEVVWDHKAVFVEDFIEARYFHIPSMPPVKRYKTRVYHGSPADHVQPLLEKGLDPYYELKKKVSDAWDRYDAGGRFDPHWQNYPANYLGDKGWSRALDEMALAVLEGRPAGNAGPIDGIRATVVSDAALKSIKTGKVEKIDRKKWKV